MKQIQIMLVDDEELTREGLLKTLVRWSDEYTYVIKENGLEALDYARNHPVHILVTDIRMPGMDGLEMLKRLQEEEIPVVAIMLSSYTDFEYARTAMRLGAIEYIVKPIDPKLLIQAVENGIEVYKERVITQKSLNMDHYVQFKMQEKSILSGNTHVQKAIDYIYTHLHKEISLKDVSRVVYLNPNYFSGLFKDETGHSFSEFVTKERIEKAKHLLIHSDMKVYQIAEAVGYQTSKYFVKVFNEHVEMTPKEYRSMKS